MARYHRYLKKKKNKEPQQLYICHTYSVKCKKKKKTTNLISYQVILSGRKAKASIVICHEQVKRLKTPQKFFFGIHFYI